MSAVAVTRSGIVEEWLDHTPDELARIVGQACPGPAGDDPGMWLGQPGKGDGGGDTPTMWRIGAAHVPGHPHPRWPVAVPLLDESHLQITAGEATRATALNLIELLTMRVLSFYRPGLVRIHAWDARDITGALPALYPLRREGLFTLYHPTELAKLLEALDERIASVHDRVLDDGSRSLRAHAARHTDGVRTEPWTLAVLLGDGPLPDRDLPALHWVARGAHAAGISLITLNLPVGLPGESEQIILDGERNRCSMTGTRVRFLPDPPPDPYELSVAARAIATAYAEWRLREASFLDLLPAEVGTCSSAENLSAPVGFTPDHQPVHATLGDATPHALVGGPTGSGKTNLLLAWLMALAARYSPDELALYLLDFKEGVSFAPLAGGPHGGTWLPHARLVGVNVNDDREFGVALLRFLVAEMRRRAAAAKRHGATKLSELRRADPAGHWPRIVATLDELQVLLTPHDDSVTREALDLLEDLARRGRSQGIHLVLASQNLAACRALFGRNALIEQLVLRVGCPRAQGVFDTRNKALDVLPRWHAIVNPEAGQEHGNEPARVPNAVDGGHTETLQTQLHARWADQHPAPVLLDGDAEVQASDLWPTTCDGPLTVVVGRGFTVDGAPTTATLDRTPGRNLAVLGAGTHLGPAVLSCAAAGLGRQGVALDLLAFSDLGLAHAVQVAAHTAHHQLVGRDGADTNEYLLNLYDTVQARLLDGTPADPLAVVIWEVDATDAFLTPEARTALRRIIHYGPEVGVHVLGWWRSVDRLLKLITGDATPEDMGLWAVCDVVGTPIQQAIPDRLAAGWEPRPQRGWLYDRQHASLGRQLFVVPTVWGAS